MCVRACIMWPHGGLVIMAIILQTNATAFPWKEMIAFEKIFLFCFWGSNWHTLAFFLSNGRQCIIWINEDLIHWLIYTAGGLSQYKDILTVKSSHYKDNIVWHPADICNWNLYTRKDGLHIETGSSRPQLVERKIREAYLTCNWYRWIW